jgi:hypothetical protein
VISTTTQGGDAQTIARESSANTDAQLLLLDVTRHTFDAGIVKPPFNDA